MMTIADRIASAKFVATDAQIEQLAASVAQGTQAGGTYLQVLFAAVLAVLGRPRGRKPRDMAAVVTAQDAALSKVHDRFYPHVLAGVGGEGVEKHRRANFARSACATLRKVVRSGHDLRLIEVATVSKTSLRKLTAKPEPTDRTLRTIQRSEGVLMRALGALVKRDPDGAGEVVDRIVAQCDALLPQSEGPPAPAANEANITAHRLHRVRDGGSARRQHADH